MESLIVGTLSTVVAAVITYIFIRLGFKKFFDDAFAKIFSERTVNDTPFIIFASVFISLFAISGVNYYKKSAIGPETTDGGLFHASQNQFPINCPPGKYVSGLEVGGHNVSHDPCQGCVEHIKLLCKDLM